MQIKKVTVTAVVNSVKNNHLYLPQHKIPVIFSGATFCCIKEENLRR